MRGLRRLSHHPVADAMSNPKRDPRKANGWKRAKLRQRVLAAYDTCAICGKPVDKTLDTPHPMSAEVDEIIPVSRGGDPLAWNNVQLTHRCCNQMKSNHSNQWAIGKANGKPSLKPSTMPFRTVGI